jgi:hypothetical protein
MNALEQLWLAHIDNGHFEQPEEDDYIFDKFCDWLVKLNRDINISTIEYADDLRSDWLVEYRKKYQKLT